eukprot:352803-Chlamydomonas_euryale.AAC.9
MVGCGTAGFHAPNHPFPYHGRVHREMMRRGKCVPGKRPTSMQALGRGCGCRWPPTWKVIRLQCRPALSEG